MMICSSRLGCAQAVSTSRLRCTIAPRRTVSTMRYFRPTCAAQEDEGRTTSTKSEVQETTEKYGLEAGLYKTLTGKQTEGGMSRTDQAKQLLAQYGSAYLITSISFAAVSFAICYAAVNAGVDVGALLAKIGLQVSDTNETVGTLAIAYAAHKALSPVRFPPTVVATPIVARWLGSKGQKAQ